MTVHARAQVYGQPPVSDQLTCSAIQVNEVRIFHCFLSSLGWLWLRRCQKDCGDVEKKP